MRHSIKKIKLKKGRDAKRAVLRKLTVNFLKTGYLKTTKTKARYVKSHLDRLVYKAKNRSESNKNVLMKHLHNKEMVDKMFNRIAPLCMNRNSGFVKVEKLYTRRGDSAEIVQLTWINKLEEKAKPKSGKVKSENKKSAKEKTVKKMPIKKESDKQ